MEKPLCTVIYPITITMEAVLLHNDITEEEFKRMIEDNKREAILDTADYYLETSGIKPLITECDEFEYLND